MKKLSAALSLLLGVVVIVLAFAAGLPRTAGNVLAGVGLVIVIVSGVELIARLKREDGAPPEEPGRVPPEYARKRSYISPAEAEFLALLKRIAPEKYEVFPQVALASVIDKRTQNTYRNELFRVADFVFTDKVRYAPLLLVELNDASHLKADRIERDRKVRDICERAGLPIVAFTMAESRDFGLVKRAVLKNILKR